MRESRKIIRKLLFGAAGAAACMLLAGSMEVFAAPAVMSDGQIFDAAYYAEQNPDVRAVYGTDETLLYAHYKNAGKSEGRAPYDPSLSEAQAVLQAQNEMVRRAWEEDLKNRPSDYSAEKSIQSYLGRSAKKSDIQNMISVVHSLYPAPVSSYIRWDFGKTTYTLGPELAMTLMKTDENGNYVFDTQTGTYVPDEDKVRTFVSVLESKYMKSSDSSTFHTTSGRDIQLAGGFTNHAAPDVEAETQYLMSVLTEPGLHERVPAKKGSDTYVEIDMTEQKAYYYENGEQKLATDIVTGCTGLGRGTPTGVYHLLAKMRSVSLVGKDYVSYVEYWMPFIGNSIGMHDASWRSSFGGTIYKTNGSHGCVNMPAASAKKFFETVPVGTYVITFY